MSKTELSNLDRHALLAQASMLLNHDPFTREDSARFDRLMLLADQLQRRGSAIDHQWALHAKHQDAAGIPRLPYDDAEARICFARYVRTGQLDNAIKASLTTGSLSGGGALIPQLFFDQLMSILKQYDRLFDRDLVQYEETKSGAPFPFPILDDVSESAQIVAENQISVRGPDLSFAQVELPQCPTWRTGWITMPVVLIQDTGIPAEAMLIKALSLRIARGVGAQNVSTLTAAALVGATAAGSSGNTGGAEDGSTSIGTDDLYSLLSSVDPAYAVSPKAGWLMKFQTLISLLKIKDKQGHPIIPVVHNEAGDFMLLEKPVYICPSMPSIGTTGSPVVGNTPIAFGDLGRFVFRVARNSASLFRATEFPGIAENFCVAYQGYLRCNSALIVDQNQSPADTPIKLLQNASS